VLFDYTGAWNQFIDDVEAGTFGSVYTMSLENDGVQLLDPPIEVGDKTMAAVDEARQGILNEEIEVPAIADAGELADFLDVLNEGE
jgi:hypothetical protein